MPHPFVDLTLNDLFIFTNWRCLPSAVGRRRHFFNKMQHHLITATLFLIISMIWFLGSGWEGRPNQMASEIARFDAPQLFLVELC
jgi:hypothetical protein